MSINSTLGFIKSLLDGLSLPGGAGELTAYISPPPVSDDIDLPAIAYVWPSDGDESRQSVPRGTGSAAGWKQGQHTPTIWVVWYDQLDASDADSQFPGIVDTILATLRASENPKTLTDSYSAQSSVLVDLGEKLPYTIYPPQTLADQRWARYDAEIKAPCFEEFQA